MNKVAMIVEDSPSIRMQVKMILKSINIDVVEAGGESSMFLNMVQEGKVVDLIIMDLYLKHHNGLDLIEKIVKNERYKNIPIIMLTESSNKDNVLKAMNLGVTNYSLKPINRGELINRVKSIFNI